MNINLILPVLNQILGRDVSPEVDMFYRGRAAIGMSLNDQGKEFFATNWAKIPDFMETTAGQKAIADFVNAWAASLVPPTLVREPVQPPAPLPALAGMAQEPPTNLTVNS